MGINFKNITKENYPREQSFLQFIKYLIATIIYIIIGLFIAKLDLWVAEIALIIFLFIALNVVAISHKKYANLILLVSAVTMLIPPIILTLNIKDIFIEGIMSVIEGALLIIIILLIHRIFFKH